MQGGTVRLLYWPETATSMTDGSLTTPTGSAIFVTKGITLTSPTVYVSYSRLYAFNACSGIGSTHNATIVPIPTDGTLSSIWAVPMQTAYDATDLSMGTASFNFTDLTEPVPMSIYSSQSWCAQYVNTPYDQQGWGKEKRAFSETTSWSCPSTRLYAPIIMVPSAVLESIEPMWSECVEAYGGVFDPPHALTATSVMAMPTTKVTQQETPVTTSAMPASSVQPTTPSPTVATSSPTTASNSLVRSQDTSSSADPPASTTNALSVLESALTDPETSDPEQTTTGIPVFGSSESNRLSSNSWTSSSAADPTDAVAPTDVMDSTGEADPTTRTTTTGIGGYVAQGLGISAAAETTTASAAMSDPAHAVDPNSPAAQATSVIEATSTTGLNSGQNSPVASATSPAVSVATNVVVISSKTLQPGEVTSLDGVQFSIGTSDVVLDGSSSILFTAATSSVDNAPVATVGGQTLAADPASSGDVLMGGTATLHPGESTTVDNVPLLVLSGAVVIGGSTTASVPVGNQRISEAIITLSDGHILTVEAYKSWVGTATESLSGSNQGQVGISTSTTAEDPSSTGKRILVIASQTFTGVGQEGSLEIFRGTSTSFALAEGGDAVTIDGQPVSAGSSNLIAIGLGISASTASLDPVSTPLPSAITVDSQVFTEVLQTKGGDVFANTQTTFTVSPGGAAASIASQVISAGPEEAVVIGTGGEALTVHIAPASHPLSALSLDPGTLTTGPIPSPSGATQTGGVLPVSMAGVATQATSTKTAGAMRCNARWDLVITAGVVSWLWRMIVSRSL